MFNYQRVAILKIDPALNQKLKEIGRLLSRSRLLLRIYGWMVSQGQWFRPASTEECAHESEPWVHLAKRSPEFLHPSGMLLALVAKPLSSIGAGNHDPSSLLNCLSTGARVL